MRTLTVEALHRLRSFLTNAHTHTHRSRLLTHGVRINLFQEAKTCDSGQDIIGLQIAISSSNHHNTFDDTELLPVDAQLLAI